MKDLQQSMGEKCPYKVPTIEGIIKKFDRATYRVDRRKLLSDIFECGAIAISNKFDLRQAEDREKRYTDIMNEYQLTERVLMQDIFGDIFALLSSVAYSDGVFDDYLGKLFMESGTSNDKAGQFFTPYSVSKMSARLTIDKETVEKHKKDDSILTVSEPACGSGGMVLAALDVLKNSYDFNYARNCFVEATDIDARCVYMCYLQLSLAGVPAIIKQQDTLSRELYQVWKTPAYIMQFMRFCKYERLATK